MSAIDWVVWGASIALGGLLWTFFDPMVDTVILQSGMSIQSLDFLLWMWNYGVLILFLLAPTVWVIMRYQKKSYRRY